MPFKKNPPAYFVWASMKDRCRNRNAASWASYGGRGIDYCERWESYRNWAKDMLPRIPGFSLERIDNDRGYSPCNCYWADRKTQQRNRRAAVFVDIGGARFRAIELAERAGVKVDTIVSRASKGMTLEQCLFRGRYTDTSGLPAAQAAAKAKAKAKAHCRLGHALTEANTYFTREGWKRCRECHNAKMRRYTAAKRLR